MPYTPPSNPVTFNFVQGGYTAPANPVTFNFTEGGAPQTFFTTLDAQAVVLANVIKRAQAVVFAQQLIGAVRNVSIAFHVGAIRPVLAQVLRFIDRTLVANQPAVGTLADSVASIFPQTVSAIQTTQAVVRTRTTRLLAAVVNVPATLNTAVFVRYLQTLSAVQAAQAALTRQVNTAQTTAAILTVLITQLVIAGVNLFLTTLTATGTTAAFVQRVVRKHVVGLLPAIAHVLSRIPVLLQAARGMAATVQHRVGKRLQAVKGFFLPAVITTFIRGLSGKRLYGQIIVHVRGMLSARFVGRRHDPAPGNTKRDGS